MISQQLIKLNVYVTAILSRPFRERIRSKGKASSKGSRTKKLSLLPDRAFTKQSEPRKKKEIPERDTRKRITQVYGQAVAGSPAWPSTRGAIEAVSTIGLGEMEEESAMALA